MANSTMSSAAIKQLIEEYSSELKKLQFKTELTKTTIAELKNDLAEANERENAAQQAKLESVSSDAAPAPKKRTASRKPKAASEPAAAATAETPAEPAEEAPAKAATPKRKPAAKKRSTTRKKKAKDRSAGYRPSEFDMLVMESLDTTGKVMIASEMQDYIKEKFDKDDRSMSEDKIKVMVTRSLQKLANRRDDLKKVRYDGRGWAYAQPKWVSPSGEVKKKYQR